MSVPKSIPLGDAAVAVDYGVTASASDSPIGPKFLRITDIQEGSVNWDSVPWCECDAKTAHGSTLASGDIVFARTGATTGKSYLIRECPENSVFASYLIRVRLNNDFDPRYVSHFFQTPNYWAQITKSARGIAQPGVNATTLKSLSIPVFPLSEQKRIAEILDRAEALRAKRRAALALLDELTQSIFLDMFGDPVSNPRGWKIGVVGDLLESAKYGTSEKADENEGAVPILRMNNITYSGEWDFTSLKYIDLDDKEREKYLVRKGQILFNRTNSKELVGKTAVYRRNEPMAFAGYLVRGIVKPDADAEYVGAFMNTPQTKKYLQSKCKNIVGMANINAKEFQAIPMPKPPTELQRKFGLLVTEVEKQKVAYRAHLAELNTLFASLQSRAFRGEL